MQDSKRDTDVSNSLLDSVGEGEGGMIWENGNETCILSGKKWIDSLCSIQDIGCLGLVHRDDLERWYGVGGGRGEGSSGLGTHVHPWLIHVNVWQNQYSIVKQNKVKIKIKKKKHSPSQLTSSSLLKSFLSFVLPGWYTVPHCWMSRTEILCSS